MFEELELGDLLFAADDKGSQLPDPNEVTYWQLRKNRTFFIDWEIDDDYKCIELAKIIVQMNFSEMNIPEDELKPIILFLHSYGGDLDQAQALCDIIEASRIPVLTVCSGVAMSAGFLIFLAGKRRYAFKQSQFLAHSGSASFQGTAEQIEEGQKNYKKQLEQMKRYILSHTNIDEKLFNKNRTKDWYISFDEIEKYGIAKVIDSITEIK